VSSPVVPAGANGTAPPPAARQVRPGGRRLVVADRGGLRLRSPTRWVRRWALWFLPKTHADHHRDPSRAQKRDIVELLASDGVRLQIGEAPVLRALIEALGKLLGRAQHAGAVRQDISADDVVAVLTGTAYAICHS
jgi:hypothetical protein